jgi:hypothetical protein
LAKPLVLSEDKAPMTAPMPTRAAPSVNYFIGWSPLGVGVSRVITRKKPPNYL